MENKVLNVKVSFSIFRLRFQPSFWLYHSTKYILRIMSYDLYYITHIIWLIFLRKGAATHFLNDPNIFTFVTVLHKFHFSSLEIGCFGDFIDFTNENWDGLLLKIWFQMIHESFQILICEITNDCCHTSFSLVPWNLNSIQNFIGGTELKFLTRKQWRHW